MSLIYNIGLLAGIQPEGTLRLEGEAQGRTGMLENAWLRIEDGRIAGFGPMATCPCLEGPDKASSGARPGREVADRQSWKGEKSGESYSPIIDAGGGMLMPGFCDSHTHVVYAGSRDGEFLDKINGLSYEEIAARGGGILNSSDLLHGTSEEDLFRQSMTRVQEMMEKGTVALEIKSGYGLNPADELKMLRVIRRIGQTVPATVRSTFLGAHAVGRGYTHEAYVQAVIDLLPEASEWADFVDVFCDEGFFTVEDTERILSAAKGLLVPKIHANELAVSGGVQVGVKHGALSVDHLERTTDAEMEALKGSATMPTMLPGSSFFLGLPYGRARDYIKAGLGVALASDYNPGSSPCGDMRFVMAQGCIKMRLTPVEAFNAVTLNSAYAMGLSQELGSITVGKKASLILTLPGWDLTKIAYQYQTPFIRQVIL